MYIAFTNRISLLPLLPKSGVVAEIGVAEGEFSTHILAQARPRRLHLIDPWVHQDIEDYRDDGNNVSDVVGDQRHQAVVDKFRAEIDAGQVKVHRRFSQDIGPGFQDQYFDWVYIDGMHTVDAVLRDLRIYAQKFKDDGFILGHDFSNSEAARRTKFGVVEAVQEFIAESGFDLIILTFEPFPTFIIAKDATGPRRKAFLEAALDSENLLIEIRNPLSRNFCHTIRNLERGRIRLSDMTMSFD